MENESMQTVPEIESSDNKQEESIKIPVEESIEPVKKTSCPKCGAEIQLGEKFCSKCGSSTDVNIKNPERKSIISEVMGVLTGIVSLILGIITFTMTTGSYEWSETYGGDAYTGIQNAAAQAANNAFYTGKMMRFAMGSLLVVIGLFIVFYFITKIKSYKTEE